MGKLLNIISIKKLKSFFVECYKKYLYMYFKSGLYLFYVYDIFKLVFKIFFGYFICIF